MFGLNPTVLLLTVCGVVAAFAFGYGKGRMDGVNACEVKILKETIVLKEKMDEVRNNRPDASGVVKRLRDGTF